MFTKVKPTAEQMDKWGSTMSLMAWTAPGFRHIWYKLLHNHAGDHVPIFAKFNYPGSETPGVACTDGGNVYINPDTFFEYDLPERAFICAHEVAHCVYNDPGTLHALHGQSNITTSDGLIFPYEPGIMQKVMDYRINAMLVQSKIGKMPADCLYDPDIAKANEGIHDVYGRVYKQDQNGGPQGAGQQPGHGNSQGQNGFDAGGVLPPGTSQGQSAQQAQQNRNPQQWAVEVAAASRLESQRSQGNTDAALQHMFDEILEPKVTWTEHIDTIIKRVTGSGRYNWRKADRRFIGRDLWLPGRGGEGAGWVVVWGDTSGSIGENDLNRYLGELSGVLEEAKPQRLTILWCDAEIHGEPDEVKDIEDLKKIKARGVGGRGGTDVTPVFDWIAEQRGETPDMFIGLTDGYFSFPDKPAYPVIWASIHDDKKRYPYGEVVPIT